MVVGSTINDVLKVTPPAPGQVKEEKGATGKLATTQHCYHSQHIYWNRNTTVLSLVIYIWKHK